ncbi:hypothetical protein M9H77_24547 [Catharanthus roseus]|uniref:Uncharacterized protein n=1 Tax=Catharanthus roseus TaxID=4058 RepID=A0ACC0AXG0_CATRO|nr:hypothetical protein M9H77_24547 [Catharanthus roseus]
MPKERRGRSVSFDRSRLSPYPCGSSRSAQSLPKNPLESEDNVKEWEEARCPVCMEHPHNAILLICSAHEKGCRPFMCDTSYRHSNCFDQFRKSFGDASSTALQPEEAPVEAPDLLPVPLISSEATVADWHVERSDEGSTSVPAESCDDPLKPKLLCPLCRGQINGWIVVDSARRFMNAKSRSCACETCDFAGTYTDLRKHARQEHPLVRPTEADPERQRSWRRLEQQRDLGDLLSTLQSSFSEERSEDSTIGFDEGGWLTVFFLVRILRPGTSSRSNSWSGASRARAQVTIRRRPSRRLWGETYDWETDSRDEENETSDGDSGRGQNRDRGQQRPTPEN